VIAVIRKDLVRTDLPEEVPTMLRYSTQAEKDSLYNTPPCWQIYICGLVFKWLLKMGGLTEMNRRNEAKAKVFYDALDASSLFKGTVRKEDRSLMNAPFVTGDKDLDAEFVKEAAEQGLVSLKGHRTVGGMRASMYNAMPIEGVEKLAAFMREFEAKHPVLD
jgi:phosphoserine aminotransferase